MRCWLCALLLLLSASSLSADTWRVEKDGSGDFTVIQDALDAAAPGDSVLVGPGRFADFRQHTYQPSGPEVMSIMTINTPDLTVLGSGMDLTTIGPLSHVSEVDGMNPAGLLIELGVEAVVGGFHFENVRFAVNLRHRSVFADSRVHNTGTNWGLTILEGDSVVIEDCEFINGKSIITSTSSVIRPQILRCQFSGPNSNDNAVEIGNGASDALLRNCAFFGYGAGVQTSLGGTARVEDCRFTDVEINAMSVDSGMIIARRCHIEAGIRFPLRAGQGRLEVHDSVIGGGTSATLVTTTAVYIRGSHLLNGGGLTVDARGPDYEIVDVRENWWGTTDEKLIQSWISESNPVVLYDPFLLGPVPVRNSTMGSLKSIFGRPGSD